MAKGRPFNADFPRSVWLKVLYHLDCDENDKHRLASHAMAKTKQAGSANWEWSRRAVQYCADHGWPIKGKGRELTDEEAGFLRMPQRGEWGEL